MKFFCGVLILVIYANVGLSLEPLIGAIAAGNVAILKPSELSPASSSLLASSLIPYLDNKAIKVIQGGSQETQQLLEQRWDKIFFTGKWVTLFLDKINLSLCTLWTRVTIFKKNMHQNQF